MRGGPARACNSPAGRMIGVKTTDCHCLPRRWGPAFSTRRAASRVASRYAGGMRRRSVLLLAALIGLPIAALSWAGVRMAEDEQAAIRQRFEELTEQRLEDVNLGIARHFSELERQLDQLTAVDDFSVDSLRESTRNEPLLMQLFVLRPDGGLVYPDPATVLNNREQAFLVRASRMFTDRDLLNAVRQADAAAAGDDRDRPAAPSAPSDAPQTPQKQTAGSWKESPLPVRSGWLVWYWDRGQNLIYWQRRPSGFIVGAALERARWMADLVAVLPETRTADVDNGLAGQSVVRLLNSQGDIVYQWGAAAGAETAASVCEIAVTAPLTAWRLQCPLSATDVALRAERGVYLNLLGGLIAAAAALSGLGLWLYRDYSHDLRNAARQVSFVNQVSHELKAPLTNIRMYAELLESDLDGLPDNEGCRKRVAVITSEAQRLSRLIGNVLTFAKQERRTLEPRWQPVDLPATVARIVDRFRPSLEQHGIRADVIASDGIERSADDPPQPFVLDPDFLEQILGNLINNVERYARDGEAVTIRVRESAAQAEIDVIDQGPGIPAGRRDEVFRPFARLSHAIDQPAGTGIGLSIARDLARLQGGDLVLLPTRTGCHFRVTLPRQPVTDAASDQAPAGQNSAATGRPS